MSKGQTSLEGKQAKSLAQSRWVLCKENKLHGNKGAQLQISCSFINTYSSMWKCEWRHRRVNQ